MQYQNGGLPGHNEVPRQTRNSSDGLKLCLAFMQEARL